MVFLAIKTTCFGLSSGHHQVLPKFLLQEFFLYNVCYKSLLYTSWYLSWMARNWNMVLSQTFFMLLIYF